MKSVSCSAACLLTLACFNSARAADDLTGTWTWKVERQLASEKEEPVNVKVAIESTVYLRFVKAESAVEAMKAEAASRKIGDFGATIDVRLNAVTIVADAATLKVLHEILDRLDSKTVPRWPSR